MPKEWYDNISIDPGLNNPLSCHFYAVDYDGNIYVIAEHYEKGRDVHYHTARINEIADCLGWPRDVKGRLSSLIDSAAGQKTLSGVKSVQELFYDEGLLVNTKVEKDLFSGIARVQSLFARRPPAVYIFRGCVNLIREIKSYWWGDGDVPKKKDDHALDELRYYVMSRPEAATDKTRKEHSAISLDKARLASRLRRKGDV